MARIPSEFALFPPAPWNWPLRKGRPFFVAAPVEIDENLTRNNLGPAEEAEAVARRKVIYETIHPETKAGAAGANARWNATANSAVAFTSATSEATGKSERAVRMAAARGEALGSDLDAVTGTSLDKGQNMLTC